MTIAQIKALTRIPPFQLTLAALAQLQPPVSRLELIDAIIDGQLIPTYMDEIHRIIPEVEFSNRRAERAYYALKDAIDQLPHRIAECLLAATMPAKGVKP